MFLCFCKHGHRLPNDKQINCKLSSIHFLFFHLHSGPQYLADILNIYVPPRQLCSSSWHPLQIPKVKTKSTSQRSFAYQGPTIGNKLPHIRHASSIDSFKTALRIGRRTRDVYTIRTRDLYTISGRTNCIYSSVICRLHFHLCRNKYLDILTME